MGANNKPRQIINGFLCCGSSRHIGDRLQPIEYFCKAKTPDGYSYSCKSCRSIENKELCSARHQTYKNKGDNRLKIMLNARRADARTKKLTI